MSEPSYSRNLKRCDVPQWGIDMRLGIKIPMRDGTNLGATLYLPASQALPAPAIVLITPYVAQRYHDRAVYSAARGYAFLTVDVRGRGNSEGEWCPMKESLDGYDLVEWLARQPYCSGRVAMCGGSYSGYLQWATAKEFPAHLCTIVPTASPYRGVDAPARNNIFASHRLPWLTLLWGRASQDKIFSDRLFWSALFKRWFESGVPFKSLDASLGLSSPIFREWISHPHRDAYWDSYNPTAQQYGKLSLPILTITGCYDADQPGALEHYREHMRSASPENRSRHYLVIGPWDHAGCAAPQTEFAGLTVSSASMIDMLGLHLQWYAWTMQDGPKPALLRKNVVYYVMGADEWRYADSLEEITARVEPLYLQSDDNPTDVFKSGSLTPEPPNESQPDHYVYDPTDVSLAELESTVDPTSLTDQRMIHARVGKQLVYHSAPFSRDTEVSGFFNLSVWLSINQPDTDIGVSIHEIGIDGTSIRLTDDILRARYRESQYEPRLVRTTEPLRYEFDRFTFVSRRIRKGNRLRLVIGPINSIYFQKNYNSGGSVAEETAKDARTVTVKLFHDEMRPSALYVPIGRSNA